MAYFSKFKIGSTSYDVKDANAGKTLAINGSTLQLKNAAGTVVSSVTLPSGGGGANIFYLQFTVSTLPENWNGTNLSYVGIYDSEYQTADWNDVDDHSVFYGVIVDDSPTPDYDIYLVPLERYLQGAASTSLVILYGSIPVFGNGDRVVPQGYAYMEGCYNRNVGMWTDTMQGKYQAVGGGGGAVVYDVYDGSGQAMISTSNISPSGNVILLNGSSAVHASDIDPNGSYILKFTDCTIPVDNIETYNKALILNALVQGSAFKVRFVNQWGDNWEYTKYN